MCLGEEYVEIRVESEEVRAWIVKEDKSIHNDIYSYIPGFEVA